MSGAAPVPALALVWWVDFPDVLFEHQNAVLRFGNQNIEINVAILRSKINSTVSRQEPLIDHFVDHFLLVSALGALDAAEIESHQVIVSVGGVGNDRFWSIAIPDFFHELLSLRFVQRGDKVGNG